MTEKQALDYMDAKEKQFIKLIAYVKELAKQHNDLEKKVVDLETKVVFLNSSIQRLQNEQG